MGGDYYLIDAGQLMALRALMTRLHSERRMTGDEMRDAGHTLEAVVRTCHEMSVGDQSDEINAVAAALLRRIVESEIFTQDVASVHPWLRARGDEARRVLRGDA